MRFEKWLEETTTTAGVAQNLAKGKVDVIGAKRKCPEGMTWDAKQLECVPDIKVKEGKKECPEGHEWDEKMQECLPSSTGIKEEEEKDCPEGQRWCPIQKKCVTPNRLREALSESKFLTLAHELMKIKDRKVLDRWYNELAKLPDFKTLNDTEKKTLMKKIRSKEKELKK